MLDRSHLRRWVSGYERAWRDPPPGSLGELFAEEVVYSPSPWAEPVRGLDELARFWDRARAGDGAGFEMTSDVVAVDGVTAVLRVAVEYAGGDRWRDLWVLGFDADGRCSSFEEWPFRPDQPDGHELDG